MKSKTENAFNEWLGEIKRLRAEKQCDPDAITTAEMSAETGMSIYQAQQYFRAEVKAGRAEQCWKMIDGERKIAYRKVKSK